MEKIDKGVDYVKISFLGPRGTFTEQALKYYNKDGIAIPFNTFQDALLSVDNGICDVCIAALENSTEGAVNATLDPLIFDRDLYIEKQLILPISHNILIKKNHKKEDIKTIISHPQALAQCRGFLNKNFEGINILPTSSTAEAARQVSKSNGEIGGISAKIAAEIYDLDILYENIQDSNNNQTIFVALTRNKDFDYIVGNMITIAFSTRHKPGELYKILDILSIWDINMTKIISRPMRNSPGDYVFVVDIENHNTDDVKDGLTMIRRKTDFFKILGTYPVIDYTNGNS